jgi:hypothetical protein
MGAALRVQRATTAAPLKRAAGVGRQRCSSRTAAASGGTGRIRVRTGGGSGHARGNSRHALRPHRRIVLDPQR